MRINDQYLHRMALDIDGYGTTAVASDIAMILDLAGDAGIASPAMDVLADQHASEVVRTRALAIVMAQLAHTTARPTGSLATAGVR